MSSGTCKCWYGSDNFYVVFVLDNGDAGCSTSTIDDELLSNINLLRNPVLESLELQVQESINKPVQIRITDLNGKTHFVKNYESIQSNLKFDVSTYHQGTYILQFLSEEGIASYKFIKI